MAEFSEGVYEKVRTIGLDEALAGLLSEYQPDFLGVDLADAPDVVAAHVADVVRRAIAGETETARRGGADQPPTSGARRAERAVAKCN